MAQNIERKVLCLALTLTAVAALAAAAASGGSRGRVTTADGAPDSAGAASARLRTATDAPDDISGPQVHFLYVVPLDGADNALDTNGTMEQSIVRIQRWLETQTGNRGLRVDTAGGAPDITFVRLPHVDAQVAMNTSFPNNVLGADLAAAGFNDPDKVYATFYDGHSNWACGGAKSPALPKLAAMYLQAWPTNDPHPCSAAPGFGSGTEQPGYFEIGLLHEVLHTIGFAPSCAPHVSVDPWLDHVSDSPTDLMYGPDATATAGWDWRHAVLDFNRDDYYLASVPGCRDLSDSPYITQPPTFADVPASNPFFEYIEQLFDLGITTGCGTDGEGTLIFCPGDPVPRQQMAAFLVRAKGLTQLHSATPTFADVPASNPFYGHIERLFQAGITTGCGTNGVGGLIFCPGDVVPRQQMAAFLVRAKGLTPLSSPTPTFADVPLSNPFYGWIERLYEQGITTGCGTNASSQKLYCPGDNVPRQQMAAFLVRAFAGA